MTRPRAGIAAARSLVGLAGRRAELDRRLHREHGVQVLVRSPQGHARRTPSGAVATAPGGGDRRTRGTPGVRGERRQRDAHGDGTSGLQRLPLSCEHHRSGRASLVGAGRPRRHALRERVHVAIARGDVHDGSRRLARVAVGPDRVQVRVRPQRLARIRVIARTAGRERARARPRRPAIPADPQHHLAAGAERLRSRRRSARSRASVRRPRWRATRGRSCGPTSVNRRCSQASPVQPRREPDVWPALRARPEPSRRQVQDRPDARARRRPGP